MSNHTRDLRETLIWVFIVITSIFMTGYYDIVLGLIPLALAGITGVLVLAGFALTTAIPLASVVAVVGPHRPRDVRPKPRGLAAHSPRTGQDSRLNSQPVTRVARFCRPISPSTSYGQEYA